MGHTERHANRIGFRRDIPRGSRALSTNRRLWAGGCNEDEAEVALGGPFVRGGGTAGVLQLVEAALDPVSQGMDVIADGGRNLAASTRRDDRCDAACPHLVP